MYVYAKLKLLSLVDLRTVLNYILQPQYTKLSRFTVKKSLIIVQHLLIQISHYSSLIVTRQYFFEIWCISDLENWK